MNKEGQLGEMKEFYRINVKDVRDLTRSGDDVVARLHANFLSLSNRLFYHNEKSTLDLRIWEVADSINFGKLRDNGDEMVDHTEIKISSESS